MRNNNTTTNNNQNKSFNNKENNSQNKKSSNKNNNDNSNNNDLKDWQNDRLENKESLIRTKNWSCLYAFEEYKHYKENNLKKRPGEKKLKAMGYIIYTMGQYPNNGQMGDTDPHSNM